MITDTDRKPYDQEHDCPAKRHPPAGTEARVERLKEGRIERFQGKAAEAAQESPTVLKASEVQAYTDGAEDGVGVAPATRSVS